MTEQEYVDATNLARMRVVVAILHDMLPSGPVDKDSLFTVTRAAHQIQDKLFAAIHGQVQG